LTVSFLVSKVILKYCKYEAQKLFSFFIEHCSLNIENFALRRSLGSVPPGFAVSGNSNSQRQPRRMESLASSSLAHGRLKPTFACSTFFGKKWSKKLRLQKNG